MTLFTSLGPSPDCMRLTQVTKYQERTGHAREATFSVLQRSFSLGWGLHGKVARMPHQSKERGGTVCALRRTEHANHALLGLDHGVGHPSNLFPRPKPLDLRYTWYLRFIATILSGRRGDLSPS